MKIKQKLTLGFGIIALLVGAVGSSSILLSTQIGGLRTVELPMVQGLKEVEESIWEMVYAANAFRLTGEGRYETLYHEQIGDMTTFLSKYEAMVAASHGHKGVAHPDDVKAKNDVAIREHAAIAKFNTVWTAAQSAGTEMIALTKRQKECEKRFFEAVDAADDVLDFAIQEKWSSEDPNLLAKEQAVREVEVSVWEAIHAAHQYVSLSGNTTDFANRFGGGRKRVKFDELMEKQFDDVEEFWSTYKGLATTFWEQQAIEKFNGYWRGAVGSGREVVRLFDAAREQFDVLCRAVKQADELVDTELQGAIEGRIAMEDRRARLVRDVTITASAFAFFAAIGAGLLLSRSICRPIARLRDAAVAAGNGDLDTKVDVVSSDEIGVLARTFNQMTAELKRSIDQLDAVNQELEAGNQQLQFEIGKRKQTEEELKVSNRQLAISNDHLNLVVQQLEDANRELKDFVYIASHDLREPLRKVSSFGQLLKDSLKSRIDGDDLENLTFMIDGAHRMTKMIDGLLTYSRLNRGETAFKRVDLNEIVEQLRQLELAELLGETGGTIEVPEPLPRVQGDAVQMRQLLQNLVANGLKYRRTEVSPRIVIRCGQPSDGRLRIEVEDNGLGIEGKYHQDIFAMFRRLHSREDYGGVGIGLAVCKKIAERHGGQIGVESTPGEGSTFWFTVSPAAGVSATSEADAAEASEAV